ncbi:MAG: hypothetical protein JRJ29_06455 [Deltaproteobacteria bacterium]|nr:hypothetical protein [Deltaproteobacteria bacterium]
MKCKNHPDREARDLCAGCGIPICAECVGEEGERGEVFCFTCAMRLSVSEVGESIKDKRAKSVEKRKEKKKKKWGAFEYFVLVSSVLIVAMWGFILFGGQEPPRSKADFGAQPRVLLFMVDSAIKRYAHYEGDKYPDKISDLIPKYLNMAQEDMRFLGMLKYQKDPEMGYFLTLTNGSKGRGNIMLTPKGIKYRSSGRGVVNEG